MSKQVEFTIRGTTPLLLHNGRLADPLNKTTQDIKKISGKRAKTDADMAQMAKLEWYGGMYLKDGKPCIPGEVLEAMLTSAAKKVKRGSQVQYGLVCPDVFMLKYPDVDKTLDELWDIEDYRKTCGVRVQRNRIMRTRPQFTNWELTFKVVYDPDTFNERDIKELVEIAGSKIGLCDWRPKFGQFEIA